MDLSVSLDDHNTRLALLERGQVTAREALKDTEERLSLAIRELRDAILKQIESLHHDINGNGKVGILGRVVALEQRFAVSDAKGETENAANKAQAEATDRNWDRIKPFIPLIVGIISAAAMYYFGPKR
jgi:hypothetical protein